MSWTTVKTYRRTHYQGRSGKLYPSETHGVFEKPFRGFLPIPKDEYPLKGIIVEIQKRVKI